ncbi:hypothetical protein SLOPH_1710 [Spraguea lophii 42_110]|uniref:Zinc-ribbon 15 domain-containing protein n=1 Tax=Spraguea lophii (strain 42_110) TaxID=1358809 RepID=S7XRR1_SPRLO|nr:hypothetical protein SLOPH_1710 [Spraguea lophii 42_110]
MCDCLIIGCTDNDTVLSGPLPRCSIPGHILCVYCGYRTEAVYKRNDRYLSVCFIPCCVVREGPTSLCCIFCKNDLGIGIDPCNKCGTASSISFNYCPQCGNTKDR